MTDPERASARLRELQARFAVTLPERLARLEALVLAARRGAAEGALAEALGAAHRLAGTAGSYGHYEAGEAVAALERALGRLADGSPDPRAWDEAEDALARARAATSAAGLG